MSGRVDIIYRIVPAIAVAIQALRVIGRLDDGVSGNESPYLRIIVSCPVVIEPGGVQLFAGATNFKTVSILA